jgi:hypothetical protein
MQIKTKIVSCHTTDSKPIKQEVNGTVILPPLVFPGFIMRPSSLCWEGGGGVRSKYSKSFATLPDVNIQSVACIINL